MPIKLPNELPAVSVLENENIFVMDEKRASTQDIRPLRIGILNLMPTKIATETQLTRLLDEAPVDLGLIGIGENGHIAFNDPPADFNDTRAYKVVTLAERCLEQQIGEGWFNSKEECFKEAISMTPKQIMASRHIISVVPYKVKADAIYMTFNSPLSPEVPATLLFKHEDCTIFCDLDSAERLTPDIIKKYE